MEKTKRRRQVEARSSPIVVKWARRREVETLTMRSQEYFYPNERRNSGNGRVPANRSGREHELPVDAYGQRRNLPPSGLA